MTLIGTVDGISFYWLPTLTEGTVVRARVFGHSFIATVERQRGRSVTVRDVHGKPWTILKAQIEEVRR